MINKETIAAISTPKGCGGIGIIRISGKKAEEIAKSIFRRIVKKNNKKELEPLSELESRHMYYGAIIDPGSSEIIDESLMVFMKSPNTYTGEDVAEIQSHSGYSVLNEILNLVVSSGAVLAEPGEFTKRAFLSGRIDLSQAEAVIDVINAKTSRSRKLASNTLYGSIADKISALRDNLFQIYTYFEAWIDFPDDVDESRKKELIRNLEIVYLPDLIRLKKLHGSERIIKEGFRVALAGLPNVGKSLIMNRLLSKDKSIVTDIPGTTRDVIEDIIEINGFPIILTDMAGIQKTNDPVESIGIQKANHVLDQADFIFFVIDGSRKLKDEEILLFNQIINKPCLVLCNKIDLLKEDPVLDEVIISSKPVIPISALLDKNIDLILDHLSRYLSDNILIDDENPVIPNIRQKKHINEAIESIEVFLSGYHNGIMDDLVSIDLKNAVKSLDAVLGREEDLDVLDAIFSNFCIGK